MTDEKSPTCAHVYADTPKAREKGKVGHRCGKYPRNGTPYCDLHGGNNSRTIEKAQREKMLEEISADEPGFTEMWEDDNPLLDPFTLLMWLIRRSGARIEWYDRRLSELREAKDLWWGKVKQEDIGAGEFAGTNTTFEAKENMILKLQNDEQKRLSEYRKQWQDDRFEAARVAGMGAFGAAARAMITKIAEEFGIDLLDESVQERVQGALEGLPDPIPSMKAIEAHEDKIERLKRR